MTLTARHKRRLWLVILFFCTISLAITLMLLALKENINLFFMPLEVVSGQVTINKTVRLGGMVEVGSLKRGEGATVSFIVTDFKAKVLVHYTGILPDLFKEKQGVVVVGALNHDGSFKAKQVLAKHDENYMSPQLANRLLVKGDK